MAARSTEFSVLLYMLDCTSVPWLRVVLVVIRVFDGGNRHLRREPDEPGAPLRGPFIEGAMLRGTLGHHNPDRGPLEV